MTTELTTEHNRSTDLKFHELAILFVGRFLSSTAVRSLYPLLPLVAAAFHVDLVTVSLAVTAAVSARLFSPVCGVVSDTYGEVTVLRIGLLMFLLGAALCLINSEFWTFVCGYGLIGLGTAFCGPTAQSYVCRHSETQYHGRVLGLLEMSWAMAALIGTTSACALATTTGSIHSAYLVLTALVATTLLATLLLRQDKSVPRHEQSAASALKSVPLPHLLSLFWLTFTTIAGLELIMIPYAGWVRSAFSASTTQLSFVFGALGIAELAGSALSAVLVDRIGKRRCVIATFLIASLVEITLPFSAGNWFFYLPLFFGLALSMEFGIVSSFSFVSATVPQACRGSALSIVVCAVGIAQAIGSALAIRIWETFGFVGNGLIAGSLTLTGVIAVAIFSQEKIVVADQLTETAPTSSS